MQPAATRHLLTTGNCNVRDLGGYSAASGQTEWRRLLRADALHRLDEAGVAAMLDSGVTTVIDLRHGDELTHQPNPFAGHAAIAYHNVSPLDGLAPSLTGAGDLDITAGAVVRGADPFGFQRLLASEPATMAATLASSTPLRSVAAYLDRIGLAPATIKRLRNRLAGEI